MFFKSNLFSKKTFKVLMLCILLICFVSFNPVYANGNTSGGETTDYGSCSGNPWCLVTVATRVSLYKYDGTNLLYYGYKDYCVNYGTGTSCEVFGYAKQNSKKAGKVAHTDIDSYNTKDLDFVYGAVSMDRVNKFPDIDVWSDVEKHVKDLFKLTSNDRNSILTILKQEITGASELNLLDLEDIYITVEPVIGLRHILDDSSVEYYYGTSYEIIEYFNSGVLKGVNRAVYYGFPSTMMATSMIGEDPNLFIGKYVELVPTNNLKESPLADSDAAVSNRKHNTSLVTSNKGYAINVFWLGGYINSCTITESSNKLDYTLKISGNNSNITYGISNIAGTINNKLIYRVSNNDKTVYGTIKNSAGEIVAICQATRIPYACSISKENGTNNYKMSITGDTFGISYGISNTLGTTNGKLTYTALNQDENIYGTLKNNEGTILATCEASRTPVTCSISSSDKKDYTLIINGEYAGMKYGISNIKGTINNQTKYTAIYSDNIIYGTIKDSANNEIATCSINRTIDTCSSTCSSKKGDELMTCAESFCQMTSVDGAGKKTCIAACGVTVPSFSTCPTDTLKNGKDTTCVASTDASKKTCTKADTTTYYKTVCKESSTIKYPGDLPTVLLPGTGFSYSPKLTGNKTCELVFEQEKWMFDYASAYTEKERENLLTIVDNFQKLIDTISKTDAYKYDSSDADIKLIVKEEEANESIKALEIYQIENLLDEEIKISKGSTVLLNMYKNGEVTTKSVLEFIKTNSSNETTYRLPAVCVTNSNEIYASNDGKCNSTSEGPYYQYFTNSLSKVGKYDTKVLTKKLSSNLDVANTCYYDIEEVENPNTGDTKVALIGTLIIISLGVGIVSYHKLKN